MVLKVESTLLCPRCHTEKRVRCFRAGLYECKACRFRAVRASFERQSAETKLQWGEAAIPREGIGTSGSRRSRLPGSDDL